MKMLLLLTDFQNCSSGFEAWSTFVLTIVLGVAIGIYIAIILNKDKGYKQGQIDALNGNVKYELKENKDKEMVWEEIKKEEEE